MSFPVDILNNCTHEDVEISGWSCVAELERGNPDNPEFFPLPNQTQVPIRLSSVSFVPLYGEDETYKVLALFTPQDPFTAAALYLAGQWWSIDEIVRTSVLTRQGICQVNSVGERIVLYVLNRIIYRTQEMEQHEVPFLCHASNAYAKILWEGGEAVGFYSVKPKGSPYYACLDQKYCMTVLDTIFIRKQHRDKDSGLLMLKDFVDSFNENSLGLQYPLSAFMHTVCKQYFEKYPADCNLLWEVEGVGRWFQRKSIISLLQNEETSHDKNVSGQAVDHSQWSAAVAGTSGQNAELEAMQNTGSQKAKESVDIHTSTYQDPNISPVSSWSRSSYLKHARIGKYSQESQSETSQGDDENTLRVSKSRLEFLAQASRNLEAIVEISKESTVENDEKTTESQPVSEAELPVSSSEKGSEEETPSEPFNGEVTEETSKTLLADEVETANEALSGESKLQPENQEEPLMLFVPLILESQAKPSEDTVSEKVLKANDSEVLTEEGKLVEKEGTEEHQESRKTATENAAASGSKEELSDNGLPNSMVTEAAEESASENVSPKTASSLEDQNEEAGYNSQEAPGALSQSSLIMVEVEGVSFQQPSGQEGQKNQLEEHSEESAEQVDQYMQTVAERAADSSSEEAEIEVPIVDRRNLRRKAKGYKGPPKKKGKPS
ncbi:soluble lamin-associated protein of 75 kDa [Indicator indicator]|uniref:soluble lamin-associated protein of 75 kDa n=1 Tax=Indicator indicator TaxID=1002788 RepID=UPI0023DFCBE1|nr:soluble lamin-associated protein of 75 kDa [Indicator indicator]